MKIAINLQRLMLLAIFHLGFSSIGFALDNYKEFRRDTWDIQAETQYFYSEANYKSSGTSMEKLASGSHYSLLDFTFETRYVPQRNWSLFASGNVGNSESQNSVSARKNSTFNEMVLGADRLVYADAFQIIPEVGLLIPFDKIDRKADSSLNSEGVLQVWARATVQKEFFNVRVYGWLGVEYRDDGRSHLMPWGAGLQYKIPRWRFGAELFGSQSISDDVDTKDPTQRNAYLNTVNAGTLKFYSVNPSSVDSLGYVTYLFTPKWSAQINGGTTLAGANSAAGFHVGAFVRFTFDMTDGYREYEPLESSETYEKSMMYQDKADTLSSEKKVPRFQEDTQDGVSQEVFKARPTQPKVKKKPAPVNQDFPIQLKKDSKKKKAY